jgi:hypothetical protein
VLQMKTWNPVILWLTNVIVVSFIFLLIILQLKVTHILALNFISLVKSFITKTTLLLFISVLSFKTIPLSRKMQVLGWWPKWDWNRVIESS